MIPSMFRHGENQGWRKMRAGGFTGLLNAEYRKYRWRKKYNLDY